MKMNNNNSKKGFQFSIIQATSFKIQKEMAGI